jgi:transposase-like protein
MTCSAKMDSPAFDHLGYEKHNAAGNNCSSSRSSTAPKTLRGKRGQVQIDAPRDRTRECEPLLVKKTPTDPFRFDELRPSVGG